MGPSGARPAAVAFILVTIVLDVLAFGMVLPVLPKLIEAFRHAEHRREHELHQRPGGREHAVGLGGERGVAVLERLDELSLIHI